MPPRMPQWGVGVCWVGASGARGPRGCEGGRPQLVFCSYKVHLGSGGLASRARAMPPAPAGLHNTLLQLRGGEDLVAQSQHVRMHCGTSGSQGLVHLT